MKKEQIDIIRGEFDKFLTSKDFSMTDSKVIKKALETEKLIKAAVH